MSGTVIYSLEETKKEVSKMKKLGQTTITVSNQGLGCMSMSEFYGKPISGEQVFTLISKAYELGINFFDTADCYAYGDNEILVGKALANIMQQKNVARSDLVLATKCGIVRDEHDATKRGVDNSYAYIKSCCDKSLERLNSENNQINYIDLYYLHRLTGADQIDEAMKAMAELLAEGKIKAVGLSEASHELIAQANRALLKHSNKQHQLAAVQSEYSLLTRVAEANGVLDVCKNLNISFVAYSPLSRALLTGEIESVEQLAPDDFRRDFPRFQADNLIQNKKIIEQVKALAVKKNCSTAQVALAWVLQQDNIIPIPGTTKEANLITNAQAENVSFSQEELVLLNELGEAQGLRYIESAMRAYGLESELD